MEGRKPSPLTRVDIRVDLPATDKSAAEKVEIPEKLLKLPDEVPPSLYDRIGKEAGIRRIVDAFFAFVIADPDIRDVHKKHFQEGDTAALKNKLIDQIGEATGGPHKYTGKNMKDAHQGLGITNKEFDALVNDLAKAFDQNKVADSDKQTILRVLETMRKDVVEKPE
jgi:hemoglobin